MQHAAAWLPSPALCMCGGCLLLRSPSREWPLARAPMRWPPTEQPLWLARRIAGWPFGLTPKWKRFKSRMLGKVGLGAMHDPCMV